MGNQVNTVVNQIKSVVGANIYIETIWINVETPHNNWPQPLNVSRNIDFLRTMIEKFGDAGYYNIGITTHKNNWWDIMGTQKTQFSRYPLNWISETGTPFLFGDWESFGGWNRPWSHQYDYNCDIYGVPYAPMIMDKAVSP